MRCAKSERDTNMYDSAEILLENIFSNAYINKYDIIALKYKQCEILHKYQFKLVPKQTKIFKKGALLVECKYCRYFSSNDKNNDLILKMNRELYYYYDFITNKKGYYHYALGLKFKD